MQDDDLEKRLLEALQKVEDHEAGGQIIIFSESQAEALIEVAKWWIALRGAGKIGAAMGSAVKWLAVMIAAWVAFKAGLLEWISAGIGGGE